MTKTNEAQHARAALATRVAELEAALRRLIDDAQEATEADEPVEFARIDNARAALAKVPS